jgi:hypothetical protein
MHYCEFSILVTWNIFRLAFDATAVVAGNSNETMMVLMVGPGGVLCLVQVWSQAVHFVLVRFSRNLDHCEDVLTLYLLYTEIA